MATGFACRHLLPMIRLSASLLGVLALALLLHGCAATAILGTTGVAGTGAVAADQRTAGTMVEDETIEWKVRIALSEAGLSNVEHHIGVTSFNRIVLLTGQVPDDDSRRRAAAEAQRTEHVRGVHNELVVGPPTSFSRRTADTLITGRVKVAMATSSNVTAPTNVNVKVVTEDGAVFLLGLVTRVESEALTETVRSVSGVAQIVRLFEYVEAPPAEN